MPSFRIEFEPIGKRGNCSKGKSLLVCAREAGIGLSSVCGGKGTCSSCKIRIMSGKATDPTAAEIAAFPPAKIAEGWRLACQTYPLSDCMLHIPPESMTSSQRTQVEGTDGAVEVLPAVKEYSITASAPSLHDLLADGDRILTALSQQHNVHCESIDIAVASTLSPRVREWNWKCHAVTQGTELISLRKTSGLLGMAVDVGTTKIAGYLVDLQNGRTVSAKGVMNPQISYGEDIITRMEYALNSPDNARRLRDEVIGSLNTLASDLCREIQSDTNIISNVVIVGNTAMHHLLLGLPVSQLARIPFVPAVAKAMDVKCRDIGLHCAGGAYAHILPNIAGYVGADHVAFLLTVIDKQADGIPVLAIDIGTNTEMSLIDGDRIFSVSSPSGPTFEGGHLSSGMRAADGAIERVKLKDGNVIYQVIGDASPAGICGSAAIDIIAQFFDAGLIAETGRIRDKHPLVRESGTNRELIIVGEQKESGRGAITLTQKDVRELQMAKASISSGILVLAEAAGMRKPEQLRVIIAGAFGTYIDIGSAVTVGMLPDLPPDQYSQVGNAAGTGARHALISMNERRRAQKIASKVKYIELATASGFKDILMKSSRFGRYML